MRSDSKVGWVLDSLDHSHGTVVTTLVLYGFVDDGPNLLFSFPLSTIPLSYQCEPELARSRSRSSR